MCVGLTTGRKYFKVCITCTKRSLRPSEWQINPFASVLAVPRLGNECTFNEAAALQFITEKTSIPVPELYACFEDDQAAYIITEYVDGVTMNELDADKRKIVERELEGHLEALRAVRSDTWGGPSGIVSQPSPQPLSFYLLAGDPAVSWTLRICASRCLSPPIGWTPGRRPGGYKRDASPLSPSL